MATAIDGLLMKAAAGLLTVERADEETAKERMDICRGCEFFDLGAERCKVCKCYMAAKTATLTHRNPKKMMRVEVTHCPKGKWNDRETANHYRKLDGLAPLD